MRRHSHQHSTPTYHCPDHHPPHYGDNEHEQQSKEDSRGTRSHKQRQEAKGGET